MARPLAGALPWTEYQLYDTFLVRTGRFERFHLAATDPILYANSVWAFGEFAAWQPAPTPAGPTYFFSVVQGNTGVAVDAVQAKLVEAGMLDP